MPIKKIILSILLISLSACSDNKNEFQGYIEADYIYIASPYSGLLDILAVEQGQVIKKGQLLFQLDQNPESLLLKEYQATVLQGEHTLKDLQNPKRSPEIETIKAQIEQAKANKALAALRLDRQKKLLEKGAVNQDAVDAALALYHDQLQLESQYQANLKLAQMGSREEQISAQKSTIESLKAKASQVAWQIAQKTRTAPLAGIVFSTYFQEGEFVNAAQPVVSLLTPENVYIEFFVPYDTLSKLQLNQKIEFQAAGNRRYPATIYFISPEAEFMPPLIYSRDNNDKLVFRINASFTQFNQFKPGQPVTVYLP